MVRLFANEVNTDFTYIGMQLENMFVDDFFIYIESSRKVYHQLKDKQTLTWGKMEKGNMLYDFYWQRAYSQNENEDFSLKIVYSNQDCKFHNDEVPLSIVDVTHKELFPAFTILSSLLQKSQEIRTNLQSIMNYPGDQFPLDMQLSSLEFIRSQIQELALPNTLVSLTKIKDAYEQKHPECPNFKDRKNVELPEEMEVILDSIQDFKYSVKGDNLYWIYRNMQGITNITPDVILKICNINTNEILELIPLLN